MSNKLQRYTVYFIWKLFYMFRMVATTHHQERKQLYLQNLVFSSNGVTNTRCCR